MRSIRDVMPLYLPTIPFALVLGVAITESAMPTAIGYSSNLMFAGASQLATVTLAGTATWLTLVITASVINLRHVMYSAAMSVHFRDQPTWFRWVGSFVLIDQMFALTVNRTDLAPNVWRRYYMGAGVFLLVAWIVGVTVGHGRRIGDPDRVATRRHTSGDVRRARRDGHLDAPGRGRGHHRCGRVLRLPRASRTTAASCSVPSPA